MPLNGDALGVALMAAVDAAVAGASADNPPDRATIYKAMGAAIVEHIVSMGLVSVVTTCPAGPGSGIGTVA